MWASWTSFTGIWILKKSNILSIFQNHAHVRDRCRQIMNAIEKKQYCCIFCTYIKNSFKLHRVLPYNNWSDNWAKTECFSHPVRQISILKIVKLAKIANFSVESGSESGSSIIRSLKESEYYIQTSIFMKF